MRLRVLHRTRYVYASSVDLAQHLVHLSPSDTPAQRVLSHQLRMDPAPSEQQHDSDAFGNHRCFFSLQVPHDALVVDADSLIETVPVADPCGTDSPPWEEIRRHYQYHAGAVYDPAVTFVFPSPLVPRDEAFIRFARHAFTPGRPWLEATSSLMDTIHTHLAYDSASTLVNTPALDALAQRKGVCQDFAHIMLGCLRSLGLPARYVSGYLLTQPPPGQARLIGADASHAWISVYVPPTSTAEGCWVDFDPTNNRWGLHSPGEDYVTLAVGRDYADVTPMRGVIQGGGSHQLEVGVTVAPPDDFPALPD